MRPPSLIVRVFKWQGTKQAVLLKIWSLQTHEIKMDSKMKARKLSEKLYNKKKVFFLNILQILKLQSLQGKGLRENSAHNFLLHMFKIYHTSEDRI